MGFHRRRLPSLDVLREWMRDYDSPRLFALAMWAGADCLVGAVESVQFVNECLETD